MTFGRRSLLPPQKRYDFDGKGKPEYQQQLEQQPRMFMRQNGDFTHFQNLKVQN